LTDDNLAELATLNGPAGAEITRLRAKIARLEQRVAALDELAHHDALTNLPNRRSFERDLERMITRARRYRSCCVLLYVDVDGLKQINDRLGHRAGDEALVQVARTLAQGLRRSDVVARIGGDEFAVLLETIGEADARDTAERTAASIREQAFLFEGESLSLSAAIGVALIDGQDTIATAMTRADADMYRRKAVA
jgi:diguanylate cyclase (GGDEF)-like protein